VQLAGRFGATINHTDGVDPAFARCFSRLSVTMATNSSPNSKNKKGSQKTKRGQIITKNKKGEKTKRGQIIAFSI
jgi:hypothetical protein